MKAEKQGQSQRDRDFSLADAVGAGFKSDPDQLSPFVFDEKSFNRMLTRERKRTERSKRQFILLLLSRSAVALGENGNNPYSRILTSLTGCIRDIDIIGWYRSGEVLGIICPEIGDSAGGQAAKSILDRVNASLSLNLTPEEHQSIDLSIYLFPGPSFIADSSTEMALYPDILNFRSSRKFQLVAKRLIDIVGSIFALIVFSPVFLTLAILIKLTSRGPVLFKQRRVGQYGKVFTFLKFRSMYVNNDPTIHREYIKNLICTSANGGKKGCNGSNQVFKIQDDPRVTRIGRFIRKTSLDELPQFYNVLIGDMSLVGPRPPIPYECENYEIWHKRRILDMKPGITGLWQVEGRSRTTFDEMVRLDLYYMRHWSLWLDAKILLQTPWAVLSSKGAY